MWEVKVQRKILDDGEEIVQVEGLSVEEKPENGSNSL